MISYEDLPNLLERMQNIQVLMTYVKILSVYWSNPKISLNIA